jgi:hypothetical protein
MEMKLKLPESVVKWKRALSAGAYWARLQTIKAEWDRCAVVAESERNITVEYPRSKGEGTRMVWGIRRDVVPRREVVSMTRYVD